MDQTTFSTISVAPARDPAAMIFSATELARVRLRALTGNLFISTEVAELSGASTGADLLAVSEVFFLPQGSAEDFVVARGDSLFAKGVAGAGGEQACVHIAPLAGQQEGPQIPQARTKTMTVSQRIREIYTAPPQAMVRLIFRNLAVGGFVDNVAVSEERANLQTPGGGYVVPVGVREQFILMPGQTLWGVALSVAPVAVSILPHASLTDGSLVIS